MSKREEADPADAPLLERSDAATPDSLRQALCALRNEGPSRVLLQRVKERLAPRMEVARVGRSERLLRSVTQSAWILSGLSVIVMGGSLAVFPWHAGPARDAELAARARRIAALPVARGLAPARAQPVEPTQRAAEAVPLVAPRDEGAPSRRDEASPPAAAEVDLLARARALAAQEPEAALALLSELAERFPGGLLAPERQVLRVEVLRALGRSSEADAQLRALQQQYPNSLHLSRRVAPRPASQR